MFIITNQTSTLVVAAAAKLKPNTFQPTAKPIANPVEDSSKVTLSSEALQHAAQAAGQTAGVAGPYRQVASTTPVSLKQIVGYKMPDALVKEMEVRTKEEAMRSKINDQYAYERRYQTAGQVLVDGKLFAEVDSGGGFGFLHNMMPGLSDRPLSPRERVEEIAQAVKGQGKVEIRYSDFVPGLGGWSGPSAPESILPPFTARSMHEIFAEAMEAAKRMASESLPPSESRVS
jgi:hypothetical protein